MLVGLAQTMPGVIYLRSKMMEFYRLKPFHNTFYFTNTKVACLAFEVINSLEILGTVELVLSYLTL